MDKLKNQVFPSQSLPQISLKKIKNQRVATEVSTLNAKSYIKKSATLNALKKIVREKNYAKIKINKLIKYRK